MQNLSEILVLNSRIISYLAIEMRNVNHFIGHKTFYLKNKCGLKQAYGWIKATCILVVLSRCCVLTSYARWALHLFMGSFQNGRIFVWPQIIIAVHWENKKNKNAINGHPSKLFVVSPKYSCTHTNCCVQYADSHKAQSRYIFNHIPPFDFCAPSHPVWSLCVLLYVICTDDMTHR